MQIGIIICYDNLGRLLVNYSQNSHYELPVTQSGSFLTDEEVIEKIEKLTKTKCIEFLSPIKTVECISSGVAYIYKLTVEAVKGSPKFAHPVDSNYILHFMEPEDFIAHNFDTTAPLGTYLAMHLKGC